MAEIIFKDRVVENQGRKVFSDIETGDVLMVADETLDEGVIYEQGVLATAVNLNKLAQKESVETALNLKANISDIESDMAAINNSINEVEANANSLKTRVEAVEGNATLLQAKVGAVESNATLLQARVGAVESNATSLQARVGAVESNATSLQARVGTVESNATSLQTKVASTESKITSLESKSNGLETKVNSAESKITSLENKISILESNTASLVSERDGATFNFKASRIKQADGTFLQEGSYSAVTDLYSSTASKPQYTDEFDIDISIRGDYIIVRKLEIKGNWYFFLSPNNTHKVLLRLPLVFPKIRSRQAVAHESTGVSSTMSVGPNGEIYGFVFTLVGYELKKLSLKPGKYLMISI